MDMMEIDDERDDDKKQRMECLDLMEQIVDEFSQLKDRFFSQKLECLKQEMDDMKIRIFSFLPFFFFGRLFHCVVTSLSISLSR
jgi:hypothetical protein